MGGVCASSMSAVDLDRWVEMLRGAALRGYGVKQKLIIFLDCVGGGVTTKAL